MRIRITPVAFMVIAAFLVQAGIYLLWFAPATHFYRDIIKLKGKVVDRGAVRKPIGKKISGYYLVLERRFWPDQKVQVTKDIYDSTPKGAVLGNQVGKGGICQEGTGKEEAGDY